MNDNLQRLAVHEAAHTVVGDHLGFALDFVRVSPDGLCQWDFSSGEPYLESLLICRFAGAAGEVIAFGSEPELFLSDYEWSMRVLRDSYGYDAATARRLCGLAQVRAEDILHDQWLSVCFLTAPLMNAGRLNGAQARELMQQARLAPLSAPPVRQGRR
jgi:hypothetical protein